MSETPIGAGAVVVTINGGLIFTLQPNQQYVFTEDVGKGGSSFTASLSAHLESSPSVTGAGQITIQGGTTATALISSPTTDALAITFTK